MNRRLLLSICLFGAAIAVALVSAPSAVVAQDNALAGEEAPTISFGGMLEAGMVLTESKVSENVNEFTAKTSGILVQEGSTVTTATQERVTTFIQTDYGYANVYATHYATDGSVAVTNMKMMGMGGQLQAQPEQTLEDTSPYEGLTIVFQEDIDGAKYIVSDEDLELDEMSIDELTSPDALQRWMMSSEFTLGETVAIPDEVLEEDLLGDDAPFNSAEATVTLTALGEWEGHEKTATFEIVMALASDEDGVMEFNVTASQIIDLTTDTPLYAEVSGVGSSVNDINQGGVTYSVETTITMTEESHYELEDLDEVELGAFIEANPFTLLDFDDEGDGDDDDDEDDGDSR